MLHDSQNSSPTGRPSPEPRKNGFHKQSCLITNGSKVIDTPFPKPCSPDSISELVHVLENNPKNLEAVAKFVQNHNGEWIWKDSEYHLRLCDLSGTIYMGQTFMQESWEELYLPKDTKMQVFGTLESNQQMLPLVEWIILVGEDGRVYAYEEEELQIISQSFSEFIENGKRKLYASYPYPGSSNEDTDVEEDEEVLKIRQRTRDFVNKSANDFEDFLSLISP